MKEIILQTYGIVLPIVLGYIVWLLKEQKKRQQKDAIERNKRIADENEKRDAVPLYAEDAHQCRRP